MDGDEIKLAKALANPDAEIRHKTAKQLHLYLRSIPADPQSSDDEKAMMRLWKALYYCLWLADKVPTQNGISQCFADGLLITSAPQAYLRAFARTIIREWTNLDQYRVEKFYVLIRVMVRAVLSLLHSLKWTPTQCEGILQVLYSEMLNKVPNGRYVCI
jgi:ribosomal RNA-processing protein 1